MTSLYHGPMVPIPVEEYQALEDTDAPVSTGRALDFHPGIFDDGVTAAPERAVGKPLAAFGDMERTFFLALATNQDVLLIALPYASSNGYLLLGRWSPERWDHARDAACCTAEHAGLARFRSIGLFLDRMARRATRYAQYSIINYLMEAP